MIKKLSCPIKFSKQDVDTIRGLNSPLSKYWDKPNKAVIEVKIKIRQQLESAQSNCAYCGLELGGTAAGEIDHIAPKGATKYHPEFTFTEENLVLACEFCNGPKKKFQEDTIEKKSSVYSKSKFKFVHPYYHKPDDHFDWLDNDKRIIIQKKTDEGEFSIKLFDLDGPKMTRFRAKEYLTYVFENKLKLDPLTENQLIVALKKK